MTSDKPERATSTQPPYRLQVLGGFRLSSADGEIVVPGAKERALLAYLAVTHPKVHRREALRELLWASRFEAQGRQSLRQALYRLRKLLGSEVIVTNDAEVSLDGQLIASDIGEFEARAATERASEVEAACRLYLGDLFAGFAKEEAFESWLAEERRRVREQAVAAMLAAAEAALAADRTQPALDFARQALAQDDLSEAAHRILIRCFAAAGRRTEALRQYETLKAHLQDQLGSRPKRSPGSWWRKFAGQTAHRMAMAP